MLSDLFGSKFSPTLIRDVAVDHAPPRCKYQGTIAKWDLKPKRCPIRARDALAKRQGSNSDILAAQGLDETSTLRLGAENWAGEHPSSVLKEFPTKHV
jgi:hypothetical protein